MTVEKWTIITCNTLTCAETIRWIGLPNEMARLRAAENGWSTENRAARFGTPVRDYCPRCTSMRESHTLRRSAACNPS